ncbi:MAG: helix-turn-helix domain-containing protein [Lactobacillaceae bacterium]|jgi:transposase|nr:helix-turn-helix domain-containing protein [Lactobacillaceae bacterium]
MTKYSKELKLKIVQRYLSGEGSPKLAHEVGTTPATIREWIRQYLNTGDITTSQNNKYSPEFKKQVVLWYLNGNGSYSDAAKSFKVYPESNVRRWTRDYRTFGDNGLMPKKKGRKTSSQSNKLASSKKLDIYDMDVKDLPKSDLKSMSETDKDNRIEELEIQVAYLKALRALLNKNQ